MNKEKTCPKCGGSGKSLKETNPTLRDNPCYKCKGTGTITADKEIREAFEKSFPIPDGVHWNHHKLKYEMNNIEECSEWADFYQCTFEGYTTAMKKVCRKAEKWDNLAKLIGCTDGGRYFNDMISAIENFNGKWKRGKS